MIERAHILLKFIAVALAAAALSSPAAWSQLTSADDNTTDPSCSLNWSDPACWVGGVVPNNNGTEFAVTLNDPTPLLLDLSPFLNSISIASSSSLNIANGRTITLLGDTGSGDRGTLTIDGTLSLNSTGANTFLVFQDGTTTIDAAAPPPPGTFSITSSTNSRNYIEGAGTAPSLIINNQSMRFNGTVRNFDRVELNTVKLQTDVSDFQFNDLGQLVSTISLFDTSGSAGRIALRNLTGDGSGSSTLRAGEGGVIEQDNAIMQRYTYDVRGRTINRNTVIDNNVVNVGTGGTFEFEGRNNRVTSSNSFTIGADGAVEFRNGSETVLEAGNEFVIETGGVVRSLDTGNFTRQFVEGNGADEFVYRSASRNADNLYSYDTTSNSRNELRGTGDTPRVAFVAQNIRASGLVSDFDRVRYDNSRVVANDIFNGGYTYDNVGRLQSDNTDFIADGANARISLRNLPNADGNNTSRIISRNGGVFEQDNATAQQFEYDVRARVINRNTIIDNNVVNVGAGGSFEFEGRNNRVTSSNSFTIGVDGAVEFRNGSDTVLEAGNEFVIETGGVVRSMDLGNFTRQNIEGNGADEFVYRSASRNADNLYSYDTTSNSRNELRGTGDTPRVAFVAQNIRASGVVRDFELIRYDNSRVVANDVFNGGYAYDTVARLQSDNTDFIADGANARIFLRNLPDADGNNTSRIISRNGGVIELENTVARRYTYDVDDSRLVSRNSTVRNSIINIGGGAVYEYEGRNNRLGSNTSFTIANNGEVQFRTASETVLEAGNEFVIETGGVVRSMDLGGFTRQIVEGNGADEFAYRSASLPTPGVYTYETSTSTRNIMEGTGDTPRFEYDNQRVRASGVMQNFNRVTFNSSRFEVNPGTQYTYDAIDDLVANNTELTVDGAGTRLLLRNLRVDGTNTSQISVSNGGVVEQEDAFMTALRYAAEFGEIRATRTVVQNSDLVIGPFGLLSFAGGGNRLARNNNINVDGGTLRFNNASTTDIDDGTTINLNNGGRVESNSTGGFTTVNFGGPSPDPVTFTSLNAPAPGAFSIQGGINVRNTWKGIGPAADLNFNNQAIQFAGTWEDFDDIRLTDTSAENSPGIRFTLNQVNLVTARNVQVSAIGASGRFEMTNASLDGTGTTRIEAANGGTFFGSNGSFSNFDGTAGDGSVIQFNFSRVTDAVLATEGTGLIKLEGVDLFRVGLTGNTQVGGQFTLGLGTTYTNLVTDPAKATRIFVDNAYTLEDRLGFANRAGNSLESIDGSPVSINGQISGSFSSDSGIGLNAGASINADGGDVILNGPGYIDGSLSLAGGGQVTVNGELSTGASAQLNVDGGVIRVNAPITGSGQWTITDSGTVDIGLNLNLDAQSFNLSSGALFLNGGKLKSDAFSAGIESEVIALSTISTQNLSIAMTNEAAWNLDSTTVIEMTGGEGAAIGDWSNWGVMEIAGLDQGNDPGGFLDNFEIPTLEIGAGASVFLRDLLDNGNRGGSGGQSEALYVDTLVFQDGFSVLNLNGLNLYFNNLVGDQSQIINQVVPVPPAIWLFGSALAGLGWLRRRGRAKQLG